MEKLNYLDVQEIADAITEVENENLDLSITEEAIYKKFDVSFESFENIVDAIFQKIDFGLSPLTQEAYVGISTSNVWHVKKEVNQQFISAIINWATEGTKLPKKGNGFLRTITKGDKPEYEIIIRHPKKEDVVPATKPA